MKTPKREYYFYESGIKPENGDIIMDAVMPKLYDTRWKRKNRTAQLKRTIARLTQELAEVKKANSYLYSAYLAHTLDDLIGIQSTCHSQSAENAKQATLLCTDAEQTTERKGN